MVVILHGPASLLQIIINVCCMQNGLQSLDLALDDAMADLLQGVSPDAHDNPFSKVPSSAPAHDSSSPRSPRTPKASI